MINFENIIRKYSDTNLVIKIAVGIVLGVIFAFIFPKVSWLCVFGELFIGALKAIAPILVCILVVSSLAGGKKLRDKRFRNVLFLYLLSTITASVVAVVMSFLFPQHLILNAQAIDIQTIPQEIGGIINNLLVKIVMNPIASIIEGNYLGIIFWSIISGIALKNIASEYTKIVLDDFSKCISKLVVWIIEFAPVGIFSLVYKTVTSNGIEIFTIYGKLVLLLAGCMFVVYFVTNPVIVFLTIRQNPYPLIFQCLKESGITAFFTRSSAANIPVNMALCEKLGLNLNMYSVTIPLGATVNMAGAAITISVMTLAAASTVGIQVSFPLAVALSILSAFGACGSSGVAGGSLLLIPMGCSLFGISNDIAIQVVGIGFIISVIQDSLETALNSSSDVIFSAAADIYERKKGR